MDEPRIYVQVTRKFNVGDYESVDVTIGLSQIPATAGDGLIHEMLHTSGRAFEMIASEVARRGDAVREVIQRERARGAVHHQSPAGYDETARPRPNAFRKKQAEPAEVVRPFDGKDMPALLAPVAEGLFGIEYGMPVEPRPEHFNEPIQANQLKTIKGILAKSFSKGSLEACDLIQGLVFGIFRRGSHLDHECKAPEHLTRGEATIIIDWLSQATPIEFGEAISAGQTFDPFDDGGERYGSEGMTRARA